MFDTPDNQSQFVDPVIALAVAEAHVEIRKSQRLVVHILEDANAVADEDERESMIAVARTVIERCGMALALFRDDRTEEALWLVKLQLKMPREKYEAEHDLRMLAGEYVRD